MIARGFFFSLLGVVILLVLPSTEVRSEEDPFGSDWPQGPGREETGYLCGACHSLRLVTQQGLSRRDWDEALDWMIEEQEMDPLEAEKREVILTYLARHFGVDHRPDHVRAMPGMPGKSSLR